MTESAQPQKPAAMLLPPSIRSPAALGLTAAAAKGRFELQVCRNCGAVQYPPREACHRCLGSILDWTLQDGAGELISETLLFHSHDEFFRPYLPIRLGLVKLDCGPTAVVYVDDAIPAAPAPVPAPGPPRAPASAGPKHAPAPPSAPTRVTVAVRLDKAGNAALVATPTNAVDTPLTGTLSLLLHLSP
jgi:uncharacterized OB-fold protein